LAAMLILGLLLSVITLIGRSTIISSEIMERASTAAIERSVARSNTNFSVESATVFGTTITTKLKNTGSTSASDFTHMDFIADYVAGGSSVISRLTYTTSGLLADQWKKNSISPDTLEQDVWNKTETLELVARLSSSPDVTTTATFGVGTPDGVTRAVSVVVADPINDILDIDVGKIPDIIPVDGDIYAIPYEGAGDDGFLKTVDIASTGEIRDEELDTLEFDTANGQTPDIIWISGDVYAIAYEGIGTDGFLKTVTIAVDGVIDNSVIDTLEFDTSEGQAPNIISISGNVYAIAYEGPGDDGFLKTVTIADDGQITDTVIDTLEFDRFQGSTPNIIPISGDVYAIAYEGRNGDGFLTTVTVASDGQITNPSIDSLEYDASQGTTPNIISISGDVYVVAYAGPGGDGFLKTFTIATDGTITSTAIDTLEFDIEEGLTPNILSVADDVYVIAYAGFDSDGFLKTVTIATDGQITDTIIDTFEFDTTNGETPKIIPVSGVYAIAYSGGGADVFLQTVEILTDGQIP